MFTISTVVFNLRWSND